jgi:hypothetical protein
MLRDLRNPRSSLLCNEVIPHVILLKSKYFTQRFILNTCVTGKKTDKIIFLNVLNFIVLHAHGTITTLEQSNSSYSQNLCPLPTLNAVLLYIVTCYLGNVTVIHGCWFDTYVLFDLPVGWDAIIPCTNVWHINHRLVFWFWTVAVAVTVSVIDSPELFLSL